MPFALNVEVVSKGSQLLLSSVPKNSAAEHEIDSIIYSVFSVMKLQAVGQPMASSSLELMGSLLSYCTVDFVLTDFVCLIMVCLESLFLCYWFRGR